MPPSRPEDQSLLDRLNALKPTGVILEKPANTAILPASEAQPVSREDALATRLRILRSQSSSSSRDKAVSQDDGRPQTGATTDGDGAGTAMPPPVKHRHLKEKAVGPTSPASPDAPRNVTQARPSYHFAGTEADDEDALDELLGALGDEDFDLASDEGAELPPSLDPNDDAKTVTDLLKSLQGGTGTPADNKGGDNPAEDDDDDSDGEVMSRAVETLLAQIGDEISSLPPPAAVLAEGDSKTSGEAENEAPAGPASENLKGSGDNDGDGDGDEPNLTLPTVPSKLVDPAPVPAIAKPQDDFERDISARMASLRGLGSLDALGLPSAPTFRPQDYNPSSTLGKGLLRSNKYTDEDQMTWCVVCLEDATIRCIGCDNDVYCARCWKEMHVGPSAGFDERGHQWAKLERTPHS